MKEAGLTYVQAVGAVGSLMGESTPNLKTNIKGTADNKGSNGIAQWHGERLKGLHDFARKHNSKWTDLTIQARYIAHELKTTEKAAYKEIKKAKTIEEATRIFTDKYERAGIPRHNERFSFAKKIHNLTIQHKDQFNSFNLKNIPGMASIKNQPPDNPNYESFWKGKSKADQNAIWEDYKKQVRNFKSNPAALEKYHVELYKRGVIGFDPDTREVTGVIGENIRAQNKRNEPRTKAYEQAQKTYAKALGNLVKDATYQVQIPSHISRTDPNYSFFKEAENSVQVRVQDEAIRDVNKALKDLERLEKSGISTAEQRRILSNTVLNLQSSDKQKQKNALLNVNREWERVTGKKAELFSEKTLKNGQKIVVPGKDATYNTKGTLGQNGGFAFKTDAPELSLQDPKVVTRNFSDLPVVLYNPQVFDNRPDTDVGELSDGLGDFSDVDYGTPLPDNLDYIGRRNMDPSDKNALESLKLRIAFEENKAKALLESQKAAQEASDKLKEEEKLANVQKVVDMIGVEPEEAAILDNGSLSLDIPFDELAKGAIGIALGKDMMDEELPMNDQRVNDAYIAMIHEHRRISEMGMNPSDEAEAKKAIAESYQIGIQNLVENSAGNRNLILGNLSRLDNINTNAMLTLAQMDQQAKSDARAKYEEGIKYISDFEARRAAINDERKYQSAVEKRAAGANIYGSAFKAMSDALGSYDAPGSIGYMNKVKAHVELNGYSPLVKGDGWGGKIWAERKAKEKSDAFNQRQYLQKRLAEMDPEERTELYRQVADNPMAIRTIAEAKFGTFDNPLDGSGQSTSQSGNITVNQIDPVSGASVSKTSESGATINMDLNMVQQPDGTMAPALPTGGTTPSNPSVAENLLKPETAATAGASINQNDKAPVIETSKDPNGNVIQVEKDANGNPINKPGDVESMANLVGMGGLLDTAKELNNMKNLFGEDEDEQYKFAKNLINQNLI